VPLALQAPGENAPAPGNGRRADRERVLLGSPLAVLRDASSRGATGQVVFHTPAGLAEVWLRTGVIVDASLAGSAGERALLHLLSYPAARWREQTGVSHGRQSLHASLPELEEKVQARRRQWSELLARVPPLSAVLEPCSAPAGVTLDGARGAVHALIDGERPLYALIDQSGLDPVVVLSSVVQLLDAGVVIWPEAPSRSPSDVTEDPGSDRDFEELAALEDPEATTSSPVEPPRRAQDVSPSEPTLPPRSSTPAAAEGAGGERSASSRPRPVVGRYEILSRLGRGGMATVYACRVRGEGGFSRLFAMKVLREHLCQNPEAVRLLLREARLTGRLHHPNVVSVVDVGSSRGQPYLVMEFVAGCSVADLLAAEARGTLLIDPSIAAAIGVEALAGLHAAHTLGDDQGRLLGLVHQDVSPDNLLVGFDGVTRVTDFGVAHVSDNWAGDGRARGKPQYLAPERIATGEVDHRADIFALGVVLYRLLTGLQLFDGDTAEEIMQQVLYEPIAPPSTVGRRPHPAFDPVCLRALERDRERRYQSAEHFRADLLRTAVLLDQLALPSEVAEAARIGAKSLPPGESPGVAGPGMLDPVLEDAGLDPAGLDPGGLDPAGLDPADRAALGWGRLDLGAAGELRAPRPGSRAIVLARPGRRPDRRVDPRETQVLPSTRASKPPPVWAVALFLVLVLGLALALDAFSGSTPPPSPLPDDARRGPSQDQPDPSELRIRIDEDEPLFVPLDEGLDPIEGLEPLEGPPPGVTPEEPMD